jgi:putative transposase
MGKKSSAVYNINYHIVWCPKFRKPILVDKVKEFVEEQLEKIAQAKGCRILELCQADPFDSLTNIIKIFKGVTGLRMSRKFPDIESKLWRGAIWSPSLLEPVVTYLRRRLKDISEMKKVEAWFIYRLKQVVFPHEYYKRSKPKPSNILADALIYV